MAYEFGNDPAKKEGYLKFWKREPVKRPMVQFTTISWFPFNEFRVSRAWPKGGELTPEMVDPEEFLDDWESLLREGETMDDDVFRGVYPFPANYWCCASLGCKLRILPGNVVPENLSLAWDEAFARKLEFRHPWFKKYVAFLEALVKRSRGRYPVSHRSMQGPLDIAVTLRGHEQILYDLMDEPETAGRLLDQLGDAFIAYTRETWRILPRFLDGCFDSQYSVWTPGSIARMQEDAIAVISPTLYEELVLPVDRKIAAAFEYPFLHLHPTSLFLLDLLLENRNLKGFQVNHEINGPPMAEFLTHLRKIQAAGFPLIVRGSFSPEALQEFTDSLCPSGLLVNIMVKDRKESDALRPILKM